MGCILIAVDNTLLRATTRANRRISNLLNMMGIEANIRRYNTIYHNSGAHVYLFTSNVKYCATAQYEIGGGTTPRHRHNILSRLLLILIATLLLSGNISAQGVSETYITSDTLQVYFRQDKIDLNTSFRANGTRLAAFTQRFDSLRTALGGKVRSIAIVSGASPEGSSVRNRYLSDNRAKVVYDYLIDNGLARAEDVEIESMGVDWNGLRRQIEASTLPYRERVLAILSKPEWIIEDGVVVDSRKRQLMDLEDGRVWHEIFDLYYADLRGTRVMIVWNIERHHAIEPIATNKAQFTTSITPHPIIVHPPVATTVEKPKRNLYIAIESNLLYDAAVLPNIGAEIGLWRGLTIGGSYQNIWLRNKAYTRWYRLEDFEVGANYYINRDGKPFRGHHVGIYGQVATWDFTINGRGYLAERWTLGVGIAYGYTLPIGRRFNLDFEVGIGYLGGNMHEYIPQDGHRVWQFQKPLRWVGPTKVGITLQWLIGRGNYNERRIK